MNFESDINSESITHAVVETAVSAAQTISKRETEDALIMMNQFLVVLDDAGLIQIEDEMHDLEKIERGMYAANLYLAACANIGKAASKRARDLSSLEKLYTNS